jgi:ankyrin repeat protein
MIDETFCSNDHYRQWIQNQIRDVGVEKLYEIGRSVVHENVLNNDHANANAMDFSGLAIDHQDHFGWTALHLAAYLGQTESVRKLLELKASPTLTDLSGLRPIDLAGSEGHTDVVNILLVHSYPDEPSKEEALLNAATNGNLEIVEALVNLGTNIECTDYRERTPLLLAVWEGHYTTAIFLLDHGANVLASDKYGNTPLNMVDTWKTSGNSNLRNLIHKWVEMRG